MRAVFKGFGKAVRVIVVIVVGVVRFVGYVAGRSTAGVRSRRRAGSVEAAYRSRADGVMVRSKGKVEKVLPDDTDGDRHQRLIVRLGSGHSILIAHNIDLVRRVPVEEDERIEFRGQYEWSDRGGTVHWTHRDPRNRRAGGWIRHQGRTYR